MRYTKGRFGVFYLYPSLITQFSRFETSYVSFVSQKNVYGFTRQFDILEADKECYFQANKHP